MRRCLTSRRSLPLCLALALAAWGWALGAAASGPGAATPDSKSGQPPPLPPPAPADFKLAITFYGVRKEPITTAEMVVRGGIAYYFASESPEEILTIDPAAARVEVLHLDRRVQASMTFRKLDEKQAVLHKAISEAIRKQEEAGGRSNRVSAEMSRALNDPALAETFDDAAHHLRLTNNAVLVDATGEPEPDAARLALIDTALTKLIQLAAARDPEAIPPFIRLGALHALTVGHQLRPAELAFTYRLAGPPRKHRWTYHLVTALTDREIEAIRRVVRLRERIPYIPFERYDQRAPETKTNPA